MSVSKLAASIRAAFMFGALLVCAQAHAQPSPEGLWRTLDDRTGVPRSEVRVDVRNGVLTGRVVRGLIPGEPQDGRCVKCPGERKDQPIIGMAILTGLRAASGDLRNWEGGEILDPDSGSVYRARVRLDESGRLLEVRGFVGVSLFGRTQTWQRVN